jgi:hypothetical protein
MLLMALDEKRNGFVYQKCDIQDQSRRFLISGCKQEARNLE